MKSERQLQEIDIQNRVSAAYESERYHCLHSQRYHVWWAEKMLASAPDKGLWLDLGCGTGWIQEVLLLKNQQRSLIGVDISDGMLRFAQRKKMPVVLGDAEKLPFKDGCFDGVMAKGVMHHLSDMASAAAEIARIIKPGGVAVLVDPNLSPLRALKYILKNRDNHFSSLHRSIRPIDLIRQIESYLEIIEFNYFGFFAYPAAFPDILPLSISETRMETLIQLDEKIARIPFLKRFCWAFKLTARKPSSGN
ncbi:MAG: class I SAM-dependent methyltransferase [Desulfobacteraceae bacterium]|nr:class I SAM-dependent methyltransferase [Desulfobacteraceae bacterium]MBC2748997.1 class I SAM-dependent methyltransferase [Desulfobacteraceae bacterium]